MSEKKINQNATFAIYKKIDDVKMAFRSLKKLGFCQIDFSYIQTNKNGAQDFPQTQQSQFRNTAFIGTALGVFSAVSIYFFMHLTKLKAPNQSEFIPLGGVIKPLLFILFGGLAGFACGTLVGIGIPAFAGQRFGQYLHTGGILLSIKNKNTSEQKRSIAVLEATGGQDIQVANTNSTWNSALKESFTGTNKSNNE